MFTGSPSSRYKPLSNAPRSEFMSYAILAIHPPWPKEIVDKADPEYHIVGMKTSKKGKAFRVTTDKKLVPSDLPGLRGISVGPVFWYNPQIDTHPCFAGIGIENFTMQGNKYLVALRVEAIIEALNNVLKLTK